MRNVITAFCPHVWAEAKQNGSMLQVESEEGYVLAVHAAGDVPAHLKKVLVVNCCHPSEFEFVDFSNSDDLDDFIVLVDKQAIPSYL